MKVKVDKYKIKDSSSILLNVINLIDGNSKSKVVNRKKVNKNTTDKRKVNNGRRFTT